MQASRNVIGGLGNLMFIKAYLIGLAMDGEIPDTYVQQFSRWWKYKNIIRATFMEGVNLNSIDKVALHIRRGDYLDHKNVYIDLTTTDYYRQAITYMDSFWQENTLGGYDNQGVANAPEYLVFCKDNQGWEQDKADRQWCRDYLDTLIPGRYELVSKDNKEEEDMNLMASCIARIGANSSFSWMACFLAGSGNIMPKAWFVKGAKAEKVEIPDEWILL